MPGTSSTAQAEVGASAYLNRSDTFTFSLSRFLWPVAPVRQTQATTPSYLVHREHPAPNSFPKLAGRWGLKRKRLFQRYA